MLISPPLFHTILFYTYMVFNMHAYKTYINKQYESHLIAAKKEVERQVALNKEGMFIEQLENVVTPSNENSTLPYWAHPFMFGGKVYVDNRAFKRNDAIVNRVENNILIDYAVCEYIWQTDIKAMETIIPTISIIYAEWVSSGVVSRLGMNEMERAKVRMACVIYYVTIYLAQGLDYKVKEVDSRDTEDMVIRIMTKYGEMPGALARDLFDEIYPHLSGSYDYGSVDKLAVAIKEITSTNLGSFSGHTIIQIMTMGSWLGTNDTLFSGTALSYPPLFLTLAKNAFSISTYTNKTRIGRAVKSLGRKISPELLDKYINQIRYELGG